uniref:Uncharacterized protein n=1 Tax=Fagus sylvatica TaxID=28930 RepID=A0A2N9IB50_FAGSY
MTIEEPPELNPTSDHIMDWLNSVSFLPSFLDDPYNPGWWDESHDLIDTSTTLTSLTNTATLTSITQSEDPTISNHPSPSEDSSKKRKTSSDPLPKPSLTHPRKNHSCRIRLQAEGGDDAAAAAAVDQEVAVTELHNATGDANQRLAWHGLEVLTKHLSSSSSYTTSSSSSTTSSIAQNVPTFASTDSHLFQRSLLKFYEVSPWFAFPNNIANACILQILAQQSDRSRSNLHILDIGVSHGVQWPTMLEALTHKPGGPPSLVRITIMAPTIENDQNKETQFSIGPPGDNFSTQLLAFAKSMNVNLQINRLDNYPFQCLNLQAINMVSDETLIICTQFRFHGLNHNTSDERTEFLRVLKSMELKGVMMPDGY